MKRIVLFLLTNLAIVLVLSISMRLLGVEPYLNANGLNLQSLLVFAARRDHLQRVIEPALARGAVVLCDRFTDATFAYQGAGRGFDLAVLGQLESWVQQGRQPDLTLWFDVAPEIAAARRAGARAPDRLESEESAFFERVRAGYAARAAAAPERFVRIDAGQSLEAVRADVLATVRARTAAPGSAAS